MTEPELTNEQLDLQTWQAFDKAIAEQFLPAGRLPYSKHPLSKDLSLFWQQAVTPQVQSMVFMANSRLFNGANARHKTVSGADGVTIICNSVADWFALSIQLSGHGITVTVFAADHVAWKKTVRFNQRDLAGETDYNRLLGRLVNEAVDVCQSLDKAIKDTLNTYGA